MKIKRCVGAIIYDDNYRVFLMTSPKWKGYIIPGGEIEDGEPEEEALRREICGEELGIELTDIVKVGESRFRPGKIFHEPDTEFHFHDYFARALSTDVRPNEEVSSWGWFEIEDALRLPQPEPITRLLNLYKNMFKIV